MSNRNRRRLSRQTRFGSAIWRSVLCVGFIGPTALLAQSASPERPVVKQGIYKGFEVKVSSFEKGKTVLYLGKGANGTGRVSNPNGQDHVLRIALRFDRKEGTADELDWAVNENLGVAIISHTEIRMLDRYGHEHLPLPVDRSWGSDLQVSEGDQFGRVFFGEDKKRGVAYFYFVVPESIKPKKEMTFVLGGIHLSVKNF